jgi:hypothetical protein
MNNRARKAREGGKERDERLLTFVPCHIPIQKSLPGHPGPVFPWDMLNVAISIVMKLSRK